LIEHPDDSKQRDFLPRCGNTSDLAIARVEIVLPRSVGTILPPELVFRRYSADNGSARRRSALPAKTRRFFQRTELGGRPAGDRPSKQVSDMQFRFISGSFGTAAHSCEG
jgi:hypothetical protein